MTWDGTSLTRPDPSVLRAPDNYDWAEAVDKIQELQDRTVERLTATADDTISVGNILDSEIKRADPSYNGIIGIALSDASVGESVDYKISGIVYRSDWTPIAGGTLVVGVDYFLVAAGRISTSPPSSGWIHKIGYALTPTVFVFLKQTSVRL